MEVLKLFSGPCSKSHFWRDRSHRHTKIFALDVSTVSHQRFADGHHGFGLELACGEFRDCVCDDFFRDANVKSEARVFHHAFENAFEHPVGFSACWRFHMNDVQARKD